MKADKDIYHVSYEYPEKILYELYVPTHLV